MKQTKKYDLCQQQFIHDQQLFRLELTPAEQRKTLHFLKLEHLPQSGLDIPESEQEREQSIDREYRSRWREIKEVPRHRFLSELPISKSGRFLRQLLCVTASGGIGKSIALVQLVAIRPQVRPGHLVFSFHISELPDSWDQYLKELRTTVTVETDERGRKREKTTQREPLLIEHLQNRFAEMGEARAGRLPNDTDKETLRNWIIAEIRQGNVTLVVDGLDELPTSDGHAKAQALRLLLSHYDRLHCVVGGRPNAITNDYWRDLFATSDDPNRSDESSEWEFWLAGLFDSDQIRRCLGNARYQQLQLLQGNIKFNPRTLDILRTLEIETFKTLRSGADAYWHSVDRSLQMDSRKPGQDSQTFLSKHAPIDILSAIAITMLMWKHDPLDVVAPTRNRRRKGKPANENAFPKAEPVRQILASELPKFYGLVERRLMSIYPDWGKNGKPTATEHVRELMRLNTQFLEVTYLINNADSLQWRNVTQRDFFAALWMTRSASKKESAWFMARPSSVLEYPKDHSRFVEVAQAWQFICGVPDLSFTERDGENDASERWLELIDSLFKPSTEFSRPTELMYLAWPNLLRRAGFLNRAVWQEVDLETARDNALNDLATWDRISDELPWAQAIVFEFLDEYQQILQGKRGGNAKQIVHEDMEDHWCDCESAAGKKVWIGHRAEEGNQPREITLDRAFELCAYPVTKRLYRLFDDKHSGRFSDYEKFRGKPRCPAIPLTWYDSMMFVHWCGGGILLTEWEWEYASRGRVCTDGNTPAFFFGENENELPQHAWINSNSNNKTHEVVGIRDDESPSGKAVNTQNGFGLYDMLGNVWEWCRNRYSGKSVSRSVRGGSFSDFAILARCSRRHGEVPTDADHFGCRVARAKPRKS